MKWPLHTTSARRAMPLLAFATFVLAGCTPPTASIESISTSVVPEQTAQQIELRTEGCAPSFNVDRGMLDADPTATLLLGANAVRVMAMRVGSERFDATLPATLTPGSYSVELLLSDGRRAPFAGRIQVTPVDAEITAVTSPVSTVALGAQAVPLRVVFANPSGCSINGLRVLPQFTRATASGTFDISADFAVAGPSTVRLDPMSDDYVVDYTVGLNSAATPGPVHVTAIAVDGQRSGAASGCNGTASVGSVASGAAWYILAPAQQSLEVTSPEVDPRNPRPGDTFMLYVTVQNHGTVAVTMNSIEVTSTPAGITSVGAVEFRPPRIDPGGQATYSLTLSTPESTDWGTTYGVRPVASARTDAGDLVGSPANVEVEVMLRGR